MARVLTAGELAALREDGQKSELFVAILTPDTVYTARLNGVPTSNDEVGTITYDGGSGTPSDTRSHMTVLVGSSAGAYDKGTVRLRESISAASGTMAVGELSDIDWADNDYLTIVREWLLRPRHLRITSDGVVLMDYAITFDTPTYNPHLYPKPIPVISSHAAEWLDEQTGEAAILFDASESYTVGGAGAMTYAWSVEPSGTASWDDDTSATPTLTVTEAGITYTVECEVIWTYTAGSRAVSTHTYRHVFVFDKDNMPMTVFQLNNCSGIFDSGGWSFGVTAYGEAGRTEIRDRTLCVLFSRDHYGPKDVDEGSVGPLLAGATPIRENIISWGWIAGESIEWNPEQGTVSFEVQGPQYWLSQVEGFPQGIEDTTNDPAVWTQYKGLTPRAGTALFWLWRSTGPQCMDAFIFPDTVIAAGASPATLSEGIERQISVYDAPPMKLWQQISTVLYDAVRAHCVCDRYGRLFVQRNLNEIFEADRTAGNAPTVMALTNADWHGAVSFDRRIVTPAALLDMSGVAYHGGAVSVFFSLSPGHIFKLYGNIERAENLALWAGSNAQDFANAYCGLLFGNMNNEYPVVSTALAAINRAFDVAPWQYATLTVIESDTERGISGTFTLLPRRVSFSYDNDSGVCLTDIEWEAEGIPQDGITGDPPPQPPSIPTAAPPTPSTPPIPIPEIVTSKSCLMCSLTQTVVTFDVESDSPSWYDADPNGDMGAAGNFVACVAYDGKGYIVADGGGIWYCADLLGAIDGSISWTEEQSGYGWEDFRCVQLLDTNLPFILVQTNPARAWTGEWGALAEVFPPNLPVIGGVENCDTVPPENACQPGRAGNYKGLKQVTPDGTVASSVYIHPGGHYGAIFEMCDSLPSLPCSCELWKNVSYLGTGFIAISQSGRYIIMGASILDASTGTRGVVDGTWPETVMDTGVAGNYGVLEDEFGYWYYIKGGSGDLWRNGVEWADHTEFNLPGFSALMFGGQHDLSDDDSIYWQSSRGSVCFMDNHSPLIRYDKETLTWYHCVGDLETVLGTTSWNRSRGFWIFEVPEADIP